MDKPLRNYSRGTKPVLPDGGPTGEVDKKSREIRTPVHYVLRFIEAQVKVGADSGACFAILDLMAVRGEEAGNHTEIMVSFSDSSESMAAAWCYALGYGDDDCPPKDDPDDLRAFLNAKKGALVECDLVVEKNNKGYEQNNVSPPWEVLAADAEETDLEGEKDKDTVPF